MPTGRFHYFGTGKTLASSTARAWESFRKGGVTKPKIKDFEAVSLGERSALVSVTWEQYREDDSIIERAWRHSYNAIKTDSGWKILVSTFQAGA